MRAPGASRAGASRTRQGSARARGMTFIELMIVVALMALLSGTLVFGSGMFGGAQRRAAATLLVAAVRSGLAHASATGKPVRLAIDVSQGRLTLEASSSSVALRTVGPRPDAAEVEKGLLESASATAEQVLDGPAPPPADFTPLDVLREEDGSGPGRKLGPRVRIFKLQTEHDEEPITEGVGYIYFWPGGLTERAIVQLGQDAEDEGLTVEVSPLTGRARIERGKVELPEPRFGADDYSEREEL